MQDSVIVRIMRFVDAHQPGWVACELIDEGGCAHTLLDKVPIFTDMPLSEASSYPQPGLAACEVRERWIDEDARRLVRVSTARPYGITSTDGLTDFVVLAGQVVCDEGPPLWREP